MTRFFLALTVSLVPCIVLADSTPANTLLVTAGTGTSTKLIQRKATSILASLRKEWGISDAVSHDRILINVSEKNGQANGATSYSINGDGRPRDFKIEVVGDINGIAKNALPRQLSHVVLAQHLGTPPRWVDMGVGLLSESQPSRNRNWRTLRRLRDSGKLMPIGELLAYTEYPSETEDIKTMYVQSMALAEFIAETWDRQVLLAFAADITRSGANLAIKKQLGIESVGDFDLSFRQWLADR